MAAIHVRRLDRRCSVTIVTPQGDLTYKPWLIYLPRGGKAVGDLQISLEKLADRHGFQLVIDSVVRLDIARHSAELAKGGTIDYSQVLIGTGSVADRDRVPGSREHALFPCEPEDTLRLASALRTQPRATVSVSFRWPRPWPGLEFAVRLPLACPVQRFYVGGTPGRLFAHAAS